MQSRKITVVGMGLLGGSLAMALKGRLPGVEVWGYVRRQASVEECEKAALAHHITTNLKNALKDAGLVVLCTPIGQMEDLAREALTDLRANAVVTDVGSVEATVVEKLEPLFAAAGIRFVGSHPMAGAEKTGPSAAREDLFQNAISIITPTLSSDAAAVEEVEQMWQVVGSRTVRLSPELHDRLVARSSHLPHLVASQLVNSILGPGHSFEQALLCATGFKDTTRVASGSPEMWRDIALGNREELLKALDGFIDDIEAFRSVLQSGDSELLEGFFTAAKSRRDAWLATSCRSRKS